jgi:hypothetical protein
MWPKQNTAFLVIHGIGAHKPFATLDQFVRTFYEVLKEQNPTLNISIKHKLERHKDWIENYISLESEEMPTLDFYEYYWDCYMVHGVTMAEVMEWLDNASNGAQTFYNKMPELVKKYQSAGVELFKDGEFEFRGYHRIIVGAASQIRLLSIIGPILVNMPKVGAIIKPLAHLASDRITNLLGDLVIYTTSDVRARNYEIRQKILSGAVEELRLLLGNNHYGQIIVAGHSLGSVIAYDALNRVFQDMSVDGGICNDLTPKIAGLVTFGSPLDKIAFFFQDRLSPQQDKPRKKQEFKLPENFVQRQILAHFHGYKGIKLPSDYAPIPIDNPFQHQFDKDESVWLNFFHKNDFVSGSLDAYKPVVNMECKEDVGINGAHNHYWTCKNMYLNIANKYF